MRTKVLISSIIAASFLLSCGGGDDEKKVKHPTTVKVERGPVLNAQVQDAKGNLAIAKKGTNEYTFEDIPFYPIISKGGFVDLDGDGVQTHKDLPLKGIVLKSYSEVITPITTFLSQYTTKEKREEIEKMLKKNLNLNEDFSISKSLPSKLSIKEVLLNNAIYKSYLENTENAKLEFEQIKAQYDKQIKQIEKKYLKDIDKIVNSSIDLAKLAIDFDKKILDEFAQYFQKNSDISGILKQKD